MYKVFFNDKVLTITSKNEVFRKVSGAQVIVFKKNNEIDEIVNDFLKSSSVGVHVISENYCEVWSKLKRNFKIIKAAGGVVKKGDSILFIFRRGKWDLPKGKIDKGEKPKKAAKREVQEECGISSPKIIKKLPSTWHIFQSPYDDSKDDWILKKTRWYEMSYSGNEKLTPQEDEDIVEAKWVKNEDCSEILKNTYASLVPIIQLYC